MKTGPTKIYDNPAVDELQGLLPGLGRAGGFARGATLDKAFASLGSLEGVQTQWGKRGERLYRVVVDSKMGQTRPS